MRTAAAKMRQSRLARCGFTPAHQELDEELCRTHGPARRGVLRNRSVDERKGMGAADAPIRTSLAIAATMHPLHD